ncbi:MbnP family protein [Crocinitomix algicola]|uniref:MbnP family protein n=1 Tax=Crocinitomix algicola TaxID=1740263 RepID=UPI000837935B|nr:MbnP family protein [Crocinitomix algicola]
MKIKNITLIVLLGGLSLTSCKKEGCTDEAATNYSEKAKKDDGSCVYEHNHDETGTLNIEVDYKWGMAGADFNMETTLEHPMTGDELEFSTFKYYISNFKLKNENGEWWSHPESYFLVDLSEGLDNPLKIEGVPVGNYTEMTYMLGVDSTRNVSGAQDGALSVSHGMFWSWSNGYIMLKAEGTSPDSGSGSFAFHLGGFQGEYNIVTEKNVLFSSEDLVIEEDKTSAVHLIANPARLWHGSPSVSETAMIHMPGEAAQTMAVNFYENIAFDRVENN